VDYKGVRTIQELPGLGRVFRRVPANTPASLTAAKAALNPVPNGGRRPVEPV